VRDTQTIHMLAPFGRREGENRPQRKFLVTLTWFPSVRAAALKPPLLRRSTDCHVARCSDG